MVDINDYCKSPDKYQSELSTTTISYYNSICTMRNDTNKIWQDMVKGYGGKGVTFKAEISSPNTIYQINVENQGTGYKNASVKIITDSADMGEGAKAEAYIEKGAIVNIIVTDTGKNYKLNPKVQIKGDGKGATATTVICNIPSVNKKTPTGCGLEKNYCY